MLEVAEAQTRIWSALTPTGPEWIPVESACGRVLASDLRATRDQPPQAMSAMDGYAVRSAEAHLGAELRLCGESRAGDPFAGRMDAGCTVRIYTGAVVPDEADAILIQEDAKVVGGEVKVKEAVTAGQFVRPAGLDFKNGQVGLDASTLLDARHIGLAAAMGHSHLAVRRQPVIGLIATGDELKRPGADLRPGEIVSSNTPALAGLIRAWGGKAIDFGIVPDRSEPLLQAFRDSANCDMIVTTGGASVGDFDLVQSTAGDAGMALDFWKIRMRPGKPLIFGRLFDTAFVGLPGNPVSSAVCAIVFLRGALQKMLARPPHLPSRMVELAAPLPPAGGRRDFARGQYANAARTAVTGSHKQDSSMFATFAQADVLIVRPPGDPARNAGDTVEIIDLASVVASSG